MNTVGSLVNAYYNLLNNKTGSFGLFKLTVPENVSTDYIVLYPEGGADDNNKSARNENIVVRVDIVTFAQNDVAQTNCESMDTIIYDLVVPTGASIGLIAPAGLQFSKVYRENYSYQIERHGSGIIYRKVSRYIQRVHQTT